MTEASPNGVDDQATHVVYNGDCPVCSFEIDHYRAYSVGCDLPIAFHDLNAADLSRFDLTADAAARRLYVLKDGEMLSGIPAFLALWAEMPRYRLLGRIIGAPGVKTIATLVYDYALAPAIYAWHKQRLRRASRVA